MNLEHMLIGLDHLGKVIIGAIKGNSGLNDLELPHLGSLQSLLVTGISKHERRKKKASEKKKKEESKRMHRRRKD